MRLTRCNTRRTLTLLTLSLLAGCASRSAEPIGGRYEEVTYTHPSLSEPAQHQISLQYRDAHDQTVMIWPSLHGVRSLVRGDLAIFVGNEGYQPRRFSDLEPTRPRLFAVTAGDTPLDITDQVLRWWAGRSGKDASLLLSESSIVYPEEADASVVFHFAGPAAPNDRNLNIRMSWDEVSRVINEVRQNGAIQTDPVWKVQYVARRNSKMDVRD